MDRFMVMNYANKQFTGFVFKIQYGQIYGTCDWSEHPAFEEFKIQYGQIYGASKH